MPVQGEVKKPRPKTVEDKAEDLSNSLLNFFATWTRDTADTKILPKYKTKLEFIKKNIRSTNIETLLEVKTQAKQVRKLMEDQFATEKTPDQAKMRFRIFSVPLEESGQLFDLVTSILDKQLELQPDYDESKKDITPTPSY